MATHIIVGELTFSNGGNKTNAKGRIDTALAGSSIPFSNYTTNLGDGISEPSSTTIAFSFQVDSENPESMETLRKIIMDAIVAGTRHTSGWIGGYTL